MRQILNHLGRTPSAVSGKQQALLMVMGCTCLHSTTLMSENVIILEFRNSRDKLCGAQTTWPPGPKQILYPGTEESLIWSSVIRSSLGKTVKNKVQVTWLMVLSAGQWCAKHLCICPFESHPIIQPWVVDQRPRGYVQQDALEKMR